MSRKPPASHHSAPRVNRRQALRAAGVTVALPLLDYFQPRAFGGAAAPPIRRMVCHLHSARPASRILLPRQARQRL